MLKLPKLLQMLNSHDPASDDEAALVKRKFAAPLRRVHGDFEQYLRLVESAVDLDAARRLEYIVLPSVEASLGSLAEQKEDCRARIDELYEETRRALRLDEKTLKLEGDKAGRLAYRVTRQVEKQIRDMSAYRKMASLGTKKDGVIFRDKALERVAEEYYTLCADYAEAQKAIVEKVVRIAATFTPVISDAQELIAELDVLLCFAAVALSAPEPYVRPKLVAPEDGAQRIVFEGLRHPCVERMEGVSFIKNGVSLVGGESTLQVVTGPNMGGKSTYIRSVGVAVLLAQIGSFVPADAAEISVCDSILARVGAGDVQARGISTFMAEMLESATILKCATPQSLVIIDELGRGTSTYDGFGLAWAISEHLAKNVGCATLFATHFQELTALANEQPAVTNRHVSAHLDGSGITMLYQVEDGPSDRSFGVAVAEAADFPPAVVGAAKRRLAELEEIQEDDDAGTPAAAKKARGGGEAEARATEEGMARVRSLLETFGGAPLDGMSDADAAAKVAELQSGFRAAAEGMPFAARLVEMADAQRAAAAH